MMRSLGTLLFPNFELLDVFGPLEVFAHANFAGPAFELTTVAEEAGPIASAQGPRSHAEHGFADCPRLDVLLVPGGPGTRVEVDNARLLAWLAERARQAELVLSVCTGSALLARAGLLDGRRATSNKRAFAWVTSQGPDVVWIKRARWVDDGDRVTSSGISAGIDMALAVVARLAGRDHAEHVAKAMEYRWHADPADDPFADAWETAGR